MLSLAERCASYQAAFPQFPDSWPYVSPTGRWLLATWMLGQNYRGSGYYGAYPPGYLARVRALFPDIPQPAWLHLFSGSLQPDVPGTRVDIRAPGLGVIAPTIRANARRLPFVDGQWTLTCADPPYTKDDAKRYATPAVNKPAVMRELARCTAPGGFLLWLDTSLPQYRKDQWEHFGLITVQRSTNHRYRGVALFRRVA